MTEQRAEHSTPGEILEIWYWNKYFTGGLPREEIADV